MVGGDNQWVQQALSGKACGAKRRGIEMVYSPRNQRLRHKKAALLAQVSFWGLGLLVSSCGILGSSQHWPALVTGYSGFSSSQQAQIRASIANLNSTAAQSVVADNGGSANNAYPIHFQVMDLGQLAQLGNLNLSIPVTGVGTTDVIAGYAAVSSSQCTISLNASLLFQTERQGYFEPVVWHELGHCAGLYHVGDPSDIMYPVTNTFSTYSAPMLQYFLDRAEASTGLSASPSANAATTPAPLN